MHRYARAHLSDQTLLSSAEAHTAQERASTAELLADLAEIDVRKLYLPEGYSSLYTYCTESLRLGEQAAYKRILAARSARRFPAIFDAVAEGRLHLSAVCLLAPHLTEDTAEELLTAATHRSKNRIERLLAARFPQPDLPTLVQPIPVATLPAPVAQLAPWEVEVGVKPNGLGENPPLGAEGNGELAPGLGPVEVQLSPGIVTPFAAPRSKWQDRLTVKPLAPGRFALQGTIDQATHDKLRYAQELLSHQIPSGDLEQVLAQLLDLAIPQLERRKFAAAATPRANACRPTRSLRHIPAEVMRAVWARDGGQCTYVSDSGHRCQARKFIEFDHVLEVARGGEATVEGLRLRCRGHNQYQAERTFGAEFMRHKKIAAAEVRRRAR